MSGKSRLAEDLIRNQISEFVKLENRIPGVKIIHRLPDWQILWMSGDGLELLNVSLEELQSLSAAEYNARYFNLEDLENYGPKIYEMVTSETEHPYCTYFQQVRLAGKDEFTWYMTGTKILLRDDCNQPLLSLSIALPIDALHHMNLKADKLVEENNFLRKHYHEFAKLGKRERDVLMHLALGRSSQETGKILHISPTTVDTHRRNIKQKLKTRSFYVLSQYARAFDLI
jgi:DNA-binding CsgD family transcriptional regulator